jgi:hypothetical protein
MRAFFCQVFKLAAIFSAASEPCAAWRGTKQGIPTYYRRNRPEKGYIILKNIATAWMILRGRRKNAALTDIQK